MRKLSRYKGEFFIISSAVLLSILLTISQHLFEYGKIDLTRLEEMPEFDYIANVKDVLYRTAEISPCERMDAELKYSEKIMEKQLAEDGIELSITHNIISCSNILFNFTIKSPHFFSKTEFSYPGT